MVQFLGSGYFENPTSVHVFESINGVFMLKSLALRWVFELEMSMLPVSTSMQKLVLHTKQVEVKKNQNHGKFKVCL